MIEEHVEYQPLEKCGPATADVVKKANGLIKEGVADQQVAGGVVHELIKIVGYLEAELAESRQAMQRVKLEIERIKAVTKMS